MEATTAQSAFVFFTLIGGPFICIGLMFFPKRWISFIDQKFGLHT